MADRLTAERDIEVYRVLALAEAALAALQDHHCGGVCAEDQEARGYPTHSGVMAEVNAAIVAIRAALAVTSEAACPRAVDSQDVPGGEGASNMALGARACSEVQSGKGEQSLPGIARRQVPVHAPGRTAEPKSSGNDSATAGIARPASGVEVLPGPLAALRAELDALKAARELGAASSPEPDWVLAGWRAVCVCGHALNAHGQRRQHCRQLDCNCAEYRPWMNLADVATPPPPPRDLSAKCARCEHHGEHHVNDATDEHEAPGRCKVALCVCMHFRPAPLPT